MDTTIAGRFAAKGGMGEGQWSRGQRTRRQSLSLPVFSFPHSFSNKL